ncbi:MAG: hypothetical protein V4474_00795 [Patescibacteria group bacterium]
MLKKKVIAIVGPTGSGKSSLGAYLAHNLGGEIIAADSRQAYRGMRVISRADKAHMVGVADPRRQFSAGEYVKACSSVLQKTRIPIVVGGTGFYIDTLLGRMAMPEVAPNKKLREQLEQLTTRQIAARLKKLDPASAKRVDLKNRPRIVRAIEIAKALGKVPAPALSTQYNVLWLGLKEQKNLTAGVEARLKAGMVAEAKKLRSTLSKKRYAELGFEFALLADYLDGKLARTTLAKELVRGEQKYAKRQWRWFKRNKDIYWIKNKSEALRLAKGFLSR